MYVVAFARSVVLYAVHVVPSVVFSHVPAVGLALVSVSMSHPVSVSYMLMRSGGTVPPKADLK